jgi:hypothetical protein
MILSKKYFCLVVLFSIYSLVTQAQTLSVSLNGRHLIDETEKPFFYLGDTAWELFHRLNREEADLYLENRATKGFTVIQAVVLAEKDGLEDPNPYGELPLLNKDPNRPNEKYFEHVDYIVDKAASLGLMIGMLPTWGSYWSSLNPEKIIFNAENAKTYGRYLGERYKDKPVIWILGGDRNITNTEERQIIEAMASGLGQGDDGKHLMTFHPMGPGLSSDYFHHAQWLDFNMFQSSHGGHDHDNGLYAEHDYGLTPIKPTLDGEPRYETIPVGFYFKGADIKNRFDDYDCRQAAYWSLLSGACGHTFGHNSIFQMYSSKYSPILSAKVPWTEAIDNPGSFQMGILKKLFTSRAFHKLEPNSKIVVDGPSHGGAKIKAALANDGSFTFVYSPRGEKFSVDKSYLIGSAFRESWFDPRYGIEYALLTAGTKGIQTYTPPTDGRGNDWILIIERID